MNEEREISEGGSQIERHEPPGSDYVPPADAPDGAHDAIEAYFEEHFGEVSQVLHEIVSHRVHLDVHVIRATEQRPFHVLFTTGMSDLPMTVPDGEWAPQRAELMISLPASWPLDQESCLDERNYFPIRVLKLLARLPHEHGTFLADGHTIPNGNPPVPYASNTELCCALVSEFLGPLPNRGRIQLPSGEPLRIYQVLLLHGAEMRFKLEKGTEALLKLFGDRVSPVLDVDRPDVSRRKKRFGLL